MRVHAGAVVLEPPLTEEDFAELSAADMGPVIFGFGAYADPADGVDQAIRIPRLARDTGDLHRVSSDRTRPREQA
jgi:hypothetical protein